MSAEPFAVIVRAGRLRADSIQNPSPTTSAGPGLSLGWSALALGLLSLFVLIGAGNLDLNSQEARLGLAVAEPIGPLGQVYGAYDPKLLFGRVFASQAWAYFHGGAPTAAALRWPAAIAALLTACVLARGAAARLGGYAALCVAFACAGSVAWIDRSDVGLGLLDGLLANIIYQVTGSAALMQRPIAPQVDFVSGLFVVAALSRLLNRGGDWKTGVWTSLSFLSGGWPAVAIVLLPAIVIGKPQSAPKLRWLWPVVLAIAVWTFWMLSVAPTEALAGALAWPLTRPPAWSLVLWAVAYSMPLGTFALLQLSPEVRAGLNEEARGWLSRWAMAMGSILLAGTFVPGLGDSARLPLIAGIVVMSVASITALLGSWGVLSRSLRISAITLGALVAIPACVFGIPALGYLAASVPYYRPVAFILIFLLLATTWAWLISTRALTARFLIATMAMTCIALKIVWFGLHVPEWNYRASQGPWGRAIGQWMPRTTTLYSINPSAFVAGQKPVDRWPADLAFAVGRRVRQLPAPGALTLEPGPGPHFLLLSPEEFDRWPEKASAILRVRDLQDQFGRTRVLARTQGPLYPDRRGKLGE